jgi:polygalacturonase
MNLLLSVIFNILLFGAIGDGTTDNTQAFNNAINTCAKEGGGIVEVPQGVFVTGTINLKSHVVLLLKKGSTILGSDDLSDYRSFIPTKDLSRYESGRGTANANSAYDKTWAKALILCVGITDAGIEGQGTIDGRHVFNPQGEENRRGPHTILSAYCNKMKFKDFNIQRAANYAFLSYDLRNSVFQNLHIIKGWDGIHIRGCENVKIKNCKIYTGDDGIAGGYWHHLQITGCEINSSCNGIRMIQPSENLLISDCHIFGPGRYKHRTSGKTSSDAAVSLEPGGWGPAPGRMDHITIRNLKIETVLTPVSLTLSDSNTMGKIVIKNIVARDITRMALSVKSWGSSRIRDVVIKDVDLQFRGIDNPDLPDWFKNRPVSQWPYFPSWAMYFRNVDRVSIHNARLSYSGKEYRKAIIFDQVRRHQEKKIECCEMNKF